MRDATRKDAGMGINEIILSDLGKKYLLSTYHVLGSVWAPGIYQ